MPRPEPTQWLAKAAADLAAARFLRQSVDLPREIAAFHYQQAAEKAIKGLLIESGITPPRSHDIRSLVALLPNQSGLDLDAADELTPFAVLARYPGFGSQPEVSLLECFDAFVAFCVDRLAQS
jgi:HEPN domain-containing protein